jgi:hypothetical protein
MLLSYSFDNKSSMIWIQYAGKHDSSHDAASPVKHGIWNPSVCAGCIFINDTSAGPTGRWEMAKKEHVPVSPYERNGYTYTMWVEVQHERDPLLYYTEISSTQKPPSMRTRNIGIALLVSGAVIQCFAILWLCGCIIPRHPAVDQPVPG